MYYVPQTYPWQYQYPYYVNVPMYDHGRQFVYGAFPNETGNGTEYNDFRSSNGNISLTDYGPNPFVTNINEATKQNDTFRTGKPNVFGKTPDEWVQHTEFLVNEGLEDVKRGINATHILQEFILMGILVGKGYSPERAYETVEEWERTGESKLLQQSKNM
ncbi:hypothetical protein GCM10011351_25540 [Paraliobacillus quinghaiensis]|uniref:Uncharacterized protein n=1 Tax=Paraliobacillus quinghaiensis TaxID=470815 RepID=A0A917TW24_9BACI|nr:hypothetical protein [Paraliobacillus quinghaiensis]GGM38303.1 hypothetical protein GCM10011351_25540 [Paraliobacillus quinghaiensis]